MNVAPVLMCRRCGAPRLHIFVKTRPRHRRPGAAPYVDCIYECDTCSAVRSWGNQPREVTVQGHRFSNALFIHAVDRHGMRRDQCPRCRGVGIDCPACGDEGETWVFDMLETCGPECPLEDLGLPVTE